MLTFTAHLQQSHVKKIDGGRPFVGKKEVALIESLKSPKREETNMELVIYSIMQTFCQLLLKFHCPTYIFQSARTLTVLILYTFIEIKSGLYC